MAIGRLLPIGIFPEIRAEQPATACLSAQAKFSRSDLAALLAVSSCSAFSTRASPTDQIISTRLSGWSAGRCGCDIELTVIAFIAIIL